MDKQKKRELQSLSRLFRIIKFERSGEIIPHESPDFLIRSEENNLGIEVREIFQSPPDEGVYLQQQEKIKENIVKNTEKRLREKCPYPLHVFINFNDCFYINIDTSRFVLKKDDQYSFPDLLFEITSENIPSENGAVEIYGVYNDKMPIKINSIKIHRQEYYRETLVQTSKGGILPPLDKEYLAKAIDEKNKKVEKYRKNCNECWLLLSSNDLEFEKAFDLENSHVALASCYDFIFDKVYFLEEAFMKVFEINKCT